jgi:hypothetical protein
MTILQQHDIKTEWNFPDFVALLGCIGIKFHLIISDLVFHSLTSSLYRTLFFTFGFAFSLLSHHLHFFRDDIFSPF